MSYQRTGDFCSIILAGGSGSKMFPLTESYPKCLLNVGNYPLIYYSLKALEIAGFDETLIVVRESWLKKIKTRVDSLKMKIKAEYHAISHLLEPNTATVLVSIRHRIKCDDVFVLSGDIYGQITLQNMAATYRKREATFCAYIQPPISEDSSEKNEKLSLYRFDCMYNLLVK
ncbi:hypothetical protein HZS_5520 [Henneguya salminicola]|nr:hypothetical protein HZS_5520 [Henneguya salminicola]